ncbi:LamG domain-containing protein [Azospirillum lipoferum]|nr:LamG domain-containing protein [Azospirillum lipoferum]
MVGFVNFPNDEDNPDSNFFGRWVDLGPVKLEENVTIECYFRTNVNARMPLIGWFVSNEEGNITNQLSISVGPKILGDDRPMSFVNVAYNSHKYTVPDRNKRIKFLMDGKWHQISLKITTIKKEFVQKTQGLDVYIDGNLVGGASETHIFQDNPETGRLVLGNGMFSVQGIDYQSWIGDISEVRIWNGDRNFLPYTREPVAVDAEYLRGYWPFWGAYPNGKQNVSTKSSTGTFSSPIFKDTVFMIENGGYYNLYTDTILNGVYKKFPQFETAADKEAITYILDELKSQSHGRVIQKNVDNLTEFRNIYKNSLNSIGNIFSSLSNLIPKKEWNNDDVKKSFEIVKGQLLVELNAVTLVYNCSSRLYDFMDNYAINAESALTSLAKLSPIPDDVDVQIDIEKYIEAAQLALRVISIILVENNQETQSEQSLINPEKAVENFGTALEIASAVIDYSNPKPTVSTDGVVTSNYVNMNKKFINYYNERNAKIESVAKEMVADWGKLEFISQDNREFIFPRILSDYAANVLRRKIAKEFALSCLSSYYTKFVFTNMTEPYPSYTGMENFQKIDMKLAKVEEYWSYIAGKKKYKITTICRANNGKITEAPSFDIVDNINNLFGGDTISTHSILSYDDFKTETRNCGNGLITFSKEGFSEEQLKEYIANWGDEGDGRTVTAP